MADPKFGDVELLEACQRSCKEIRSEVSKDVVGQQKVVEQLLIALLAGGHCLLVGVPGLAKTLLVRTLARTLSLSFGRIQFTPDLMPADITGTEILQEDPDTRERRFKFLPGPIFANMVLADEINRTPPKTQAALLQAMQEYSVTVGGTDYPLEMPFFVLATQNPIEQEGTYPLPEAQLDRFMLFIEVDYPDEDEELLIMKQGSHTESDVVQIVIDSTMLLEFQSLVQKIPIADAVFQYARDLVRATRPQAVGNAGKSFEHIQQWLTWGAGPRAAQHLIRAGQARAAIHGQAYVACEDIAAVCLPVLRHRLRLSFTAQSENIQVSDVIQKLLDEIPMYKKVERQT